MLPARLLDERNRFQQLFAAQPRIQTTYGLRIGVDKKYTDIHHLFPPKHEPVLTHIAIRDDGLQENENDLGLAVELGSADADPHRTYVQGHFDQLILVEAMNHTHRLLDLTPYITGGVVLIIVDARRGANLTILDGAEHRLVSFAEVHAHRHATIQYLTLKTKTSIQMRNRKSHAYHDAQVHWQEALLDGTYVRSSTTSCLEGSGAATTLFGLFLGDKSNLFDIYNAAEHHAPHTLSDMKNKGALLDKAKAVYRGLINIRPGSKDCDGYQKQDTLLLSEQAEIDAVPNLEIENNEVTCSHGVTVGQLDPEQLFYLRSRGITPDQALRLIIRGFFSPLLDALPPDQKTALADIITEKTRNVRYTA